MRRTSTVALALGCWWLTGARAQETESPPPEGPDLEFLEYLGSWAEEDDEWLAIEELREDNAEDADKDPEKRVESESGDEHESD
jgi:hypothetical protein